MGLARRVVFEGVGWLLIVGGIAALILPGPGLLMLFAGLAILSQQYDWAERRLDPIKYRALKGAAESVENVPRIVVSILGVCFLVACGVVWILKPPPPDWWPVRDSWWLIGGAGTGSTLIASAAIAAGLLVYSYRRFHGKPEAVEALERQVEEADQEYAELRED